jgi:hypothetical protein
MAFVPVAAQAMRKINEVNLNLFGHTFAFDLSLPFSWTIFYLASLFFAVASLIYQTCCPEIIRLYANATEFIENGNGLRSVFKRIESVLRSERIFTSNNQFMSSRNWAQEFQKKYFKGNSNFNEEWIRSERVYFADPPFDSEEFKDREKAIQQAFNAANEIADFSSRTARAICSFCYLIGFSLLSLIVLQNIFYVFYVYPDPANFSNWLIGGKP